MTMLEEVIQKLKTVDDTILERVKTILDDAALETSFTEPRDVRIHRSPEQIAKIHRLLDELSEPMSEEDARAFDEAVKRRPFRSTPVDFGDDE
jgi:hypothetical protein